jgi:hypothetical protein
MIFLDRPIRVQNSIQFNTLTKIRLPANSSTHQNRHHCIAAFKHLAALSSLLPITGIASHNPKQSVFKTLVASEWCEVRNPFRCPPRRRRPGSCMHLRKAASLLMDRHCSVAAPPSQVWETAVAKPYLLKVMLLLMNPTTRRFELLQLEFDSLKALVSDVLNQIPVRVTEESLKSQQYSGICGKSATLTASDQLLCSFCVGNDVLVAVPSSLTAKECTRLAKPILSDDKVLSMVCVQALLHRSDLRSASIVCLRLTLLGCYYIPCAAHAMWF